MSKNMFIVTTDKKTANKLTEHGLRLLSAANGVYTFENKIGIINFSEIDMAKIAYTNMLSL